MKKLFIAIQLIFLFTTLTANERPVLLIIGTRPEAIKVLPVYHALKKINIPTELCCTGQHIDMVNEILDLLHITPDYAFNIMKPGQDLAYVTEATLNKTSALLKTLNPSLVLVQGDTTSAMSAALAAYYNKIPVGHIEAGLRTHNIYAPFPEEMNRQIIGRVASFHFTPTSLSSQNLKEENIAPDTIYETGNTVVDALYMVRDKIENKEITPSRLVSTTVQDLKNQKKPFFLLTAHRRESLESGMEEAMTAIYNFLLVHPEIAVIYPVHPNPKITAILKKTLLTTLPNVLLFPPLPYNDLVYLLLECKGVLTDSGGIQEEAVSLNKPTLVLRNETDRPEGLVGGITRLVGTNPQLITEGFQALVDQPEAPSTKGLSPYGDGHASERIAEIIKLYLTSSQL